MTDVAGMGKRETRGGFAPHPIQPPPVFVRPPQQAPALPCLRGTACRRRPRECRRPRSLPHDR